MEWSCKSTQWSAKDQEDVREDAKENHGITTLRNGPGLKVQYSSGMQRIDEYDRDYQDRPPSCLLYDHSSQEDGN